MFMGLGYLTGTCRQGAIYSKGVPRHQKIFGAIACYRMERGGKMPDSLNELIQANTISMDDVSYQGEKGRIYIRYMQPFSFTPDYAVLLYDEVREGVLEALVTDLRGRQGVAGPGLGLFELLQVHVPRHRAIWRAMSEFAAKNEERFPDSWDELARAGFLPYAPSTPLGSFHEPLPKV